MVQPKQPPLSIRLPPDLAAEVQKHADEQELTRHAAIIALLRQALAGHSPTKQKLQELQTAQMLEVAKPKRAARTLQAFPSPLVDEDKFKALVASAKAPPKTKARAEPGPIAEPKVSVSVPLKTNARASFDRLQKKGKK